MTAQYILCADGACSGNPGPGGYGWELWDCEPTANGSVLDYGSGRAPDTTNNIMELAAAIDAIQSIANGPWQAGVVLLRLDSEYVLNGIFQWMENWKKKGWKTASKKPVKNKDLWLLLDQALERARERGFVFQNNWVKGHNSDIGNERVDTMAVEERDKASTELHHCDAQQDDVASLIKAPSGAPQNAVPSMEDFDNPHNPLHDVMRTMAAAGTEQEEMYPSQVELMKTILDLYASGDYSVKKVIQEIRANKIALGL